MRTLILAALMALMPMVAEAQQDTMKFHPTALAFTFGSIGNPVDSVQMYNFDWARAGVIAQATRSLEVALDYNFTKQAIVLAYGRLHRDVGNKVQLSLIGGQFLSPTYYLYPAPKALQLSRYPDAINPYTGCPRGFGAWAESKDWAVRLSLSDSNHVSGALTVHGLSVYAENNVGYGAIIDATNLPGRFVHPFVGVSVDKANHRQAFVQTWGRLSDNLRLYAEVDFDNRQRTTGLGGLTYGYAQNSFLKAYLDGKDHKVYAKFTYYFGRAL